MHLDRRTLLAGAAAATLARPALTQPERNRVLRFIPYADLNTLDTLWTTVDITRDHGYLIYDTLYGADDTLVPRPQLAEGHVFEPDNRACTITLRSGTRFHDGEPIRAQDCVASLRRWARRDPFGATLMEATEELSAPDDRTIRFRLRTPFPLLPMALGKASVPVCAMMPERLANTDPFRQVTELIGSGPFRFKADERVPGSLNVYTKFERYVPRNEAPRGWTSGGKAVHFDRVEWRTMPDPSTATNALLAGEADWQEYAYHDQLPLLRRGRNVRVQVLDRTGFVCMVRMNHLQAPFNDPAIRRALWHALDQTQFMQAIVGPGERDLYHVPLGFFCPGTPMASDAGLEALTSPRSVERSRAALREAGYRGEPVVLMIPSTSSAGPPIGAVMEDLLKRVGMAIEVYSVEFNAMLQRRNRKGPVAEGGWSLFVTNWSGADWLDPAGHISLRGNGEAGYAGWATLPRIEELRTAWFRAPDLAAQQAICREIQLEAMREVPYYPVGQFLQPTAYRANLTGVQEGFATFWNVRRG